MTAPVRASARAVIALVGVGACGGTDPVTLALRGGAETPYRGTVESSVTLSDGDLSLTIDREMTLRFTLGSRAHGGGGHGGTASGGFAGVARIDTARGVLNTPHGRAVLDGRTLAGRVLAYTASARGGRPAWPDSVPSLNYQMSGGDVGVDAVLDFVFPPLPSAAVRVGETWESDWERRQVDGMGVSEGSVRATSRLAGLSTRRGVEVARVELTLAGAVRAPARVEGGPSSEGQLSATGYYLIGLADGVVHELVLDETVTGTAVVMGNTRPFTQTARIRLAAHPDAPQ